MTLQELIDISNSRTEYLEIIETPEEVRQFLLRYAQEIAPIDNKKGEDDLIATNKIKTCSHFHIKLTHNNQILKCCDCKLYFPTDKLDRLDICHWG